MTHRNHSTPTSVLLERYGIVKNPVTRAVYREIIARRLGVTDSHEQQLATQHEQAHKFMQRLTYSFESRSKMEKYFGEK